MLRIMLLVILAALAPFPGLAARGFSVVKHTDLENRRMIEVLADFYDRIRPGDPVVFVFAGHGWSDGRQNYLLPADIRAEGSETLLAKDSFALRNGLNGILDEVSARGPALTVAIVDACRNNPFQPVNGTREHRARAWAGTDLGPGGHLCCFLGRGRPDRAGPAVGCRPLALFGVPPAFPCATGPPTGPAIGVQGDATGGQPCRADHRPSAAARLI